MSTSIDCPLAKAADQFGSRPALIDDNRTITYQQYHRMADSFAGQLIGAGLHQGKPVAILAQSCLEYPILLMAIIRAGALAFPLNQSFPADYMVGIMNRIGCDLVVADRNNLPGLPDGIRVISMDSMDGNSRPVSADHWQYQFPSEQPATIVLTSGSSGHPKEAVHTFGNHYFSALGANRLIDLSPSDRWLLSLPLYHVSGLGIIFRTMLAGAATVISSDRINLNLVRKLRITHLSLVPTQLQDFLDNSHDSQSMNALKSIPALKAVLVGGAPLPQMQVIKAIKVDLPLYVTYGLTEMTSQVTTARANESDKHPSGCGTPLPYREVGISDEGEILVCGECLFQGYYVNGQVVCPTDKSGWFHTGDRGRFDEQGNLILLGRLDNMFVSGGENIQPEEIERAISTVLDGCRVVVVPVPSDRFGHRPVSFIEGDFDSQWLRLKLEEKLPPFMIPDHFYDWPDRLEDVGMKLNRQFFVDLAAERSLSEKS